MRGIILGVLLCACDDVPPLVFDEANTPTDGSTDAGCPTEVPSFASKCCGNVPCFGQNCAASCSMCEMKCMPDELCCANSMGNVVCRSKNMLNCP